MTLVWWTDVAGDSTVEYGLTPRPWGSPRASRRRAPARLARPAPVTSYRSPPSCPGRATTIGSARTGPSYRRRTTSRPFAPPFDPGDVFFTVVGDWGDSRGGEANVASLQDAADPQIIMTVGDNVYPNGTQSEWDTNALPYYQSPMQRIPFFPALGNHDVNSVGPANWADAGRPPVHA